MIQKISKYFSEVNQELIKVSWPSREELYGSVTVVIILCVVLSLFVFCIDYVLNRLLDILF
ncbi:preprotein translocase subunit SecE [bacterium]|jgi:preprotein translocase subunit SecE|nr:preprotein translocase subunit SecE [bacterium]